MKKNILIFMVIALILTSCGNKSAAADSKEKMLSYLDGKFNEIEATVETNEEYSTTYYLIVRNGDIKDINFLKNEENPDSSGFEKNNNNGKPGILWEKYVYDKEKNEIRFFKKDGNLIVSLIFTTNEMKVNDYGKWMESSSGWFENNIHKKDESIQFEIGAYIRFGSEYFDDLDRTYEYFIGKKK